MSFFRAFLWDIVSYESMVFLKITITITGKVIEMLHDIVFALFL